MQLEQDNTVYTQISLRYWSDKSAAIFSIPPSEPVLYPASNQPHSLIKTTVVCLITSGIIACGGEAQFPGPEEPPVTVQGGSPPSSPDDESDGHHNNTSQIEGRYTTVNDAVWPPQPTAASNIQAYIPGRRVDEQIIKIEKAGQLISHNQKAQDLIGNDQTILKTTVVAGKSPEQDLTEFEYFNYKTNQVMRIIVSQQQNIQVSSAAAFLYQPPETRAEVEKAIRLAAIALTKQGYNNIANLTGTALLAHPTSSEISVNERSFYSQRYLYVTFGEGSGALPQYRAMVNLSDESVSNSGVVQ